MSYEDVANLAADAEFGRRIGAALTTESVVKTDDALADAILKNPALSVQMFMPLVSSAPGFGAAFAAGGQESITDGQILSAVQSSWGRVAELYASTLNPAA
jgi:hypothetical protein